MKSPDLHTENESVRSLVQTLAQSLVDQNEDVRVEIRPGIPVTLVLLVAPKEIGKVIGRNGRTARAVRTILGAVGMKLQRHYALDIQNAPDPSTN